MEDYVQVPVPKQFVSRVYALLAELTAQLSGNQEVQKSAVVVPLSFASAQPTDRQRGDLRYQLLEDFLRQNSSGLVELSLTEIEQICGGQLPPSAYKHRAWWANTDSHSHAQAWQRAGFRVARVDVDSHKQNTNVVFRRI